MTQLYHYTCADHGEPGIRASGVIRPGLDELVWLTDLAEPIRDALGLTQHVTRCDRMAYRFAVQDNGYTLPWHRARLALPRVYVDELEAAPGVMPMHWWVSGRPVRVVRRRTSS